MLVKNLDVSAGLCNGTRLQVMEIKKHNLRCRFLTGPRAGGADFLLPKIKIDHTDSAREGNPHFSRFQFPMRLCFSMTVNKVRTCFLCIFHIFFRHKVRRFRELVSTLPMTVSATDTCTSPSLGFREWPTSKSSPLQLTEKYAM
jgi:hypothetical protein